MSENSSQIIEKAFAKTDALTLKTVVKKLHTDDNNEAKYSIPTTKSKVRKSTEVKDLLGEIYFQDDAIPNENVEKAISKLIVKYENQKNQEGC